MNRQPCCWIREECGISFEEAVRRLRVHPRYLRSIERGTQPLNYTLAWRMAKLYQCSEFAFLRSSSEPIAAPR